MKINRKTALVVWQEMYGDVLWARDFAGRYMYVEDFGDRDVYRYVNGRYLYTGWNLHHILPKANGGTNAKHNLICTNIITNDEAGNRTTFSIDDVKYQVQRNFGEQGHSIVEID